MAKKTAAPTKKARTRTTITQSGLGISARIDLAPDDPTRDTNLESVMVFINQAMRRFKMAAEADTYNRTEGLIDLQMVDGEGQWDPDVKAMRIRKKRPCLTINRFIPMISHVANELRAARPSIQIDPVSGGADPESAEIRQGLIRHIEIDSGAETVYDNCFDAMLEKGWSWFRIISEYESENSFQQILKIEGFENDFCVYADPNAKHPTRKDMDWGFVIDDIPIGEYLSTYKDSKIASLTNFSGIGDDAADWLSTQHVRVAEYYYVEKEEAVLYQLEDGTGYWKDDLQEVNGMFVNKELFEQSEKGEIQPELVPIIPVRIDPATGKPFQRKSQRRRVKWCKINAVEILEGNDDQTAGRDWKGQYIPLIMVQGRLKNIKGQRRLSGMVRNNRDSQRMYNYWVTAFTEMVALAPKSPWTAAAGQIEKYKAIWDSANEEAWPYLPYDPVNVNGQLVPPPNRQTFEPPVQAMIQAIRQADNDIKLGFNIFDASLGQRGPDESGKAILARKDESDSGNLNWIDNMKKAIQHCGDVLLDLIPSRYDAARTISIVRPDNKRDAVQINQEFEGKDGKIKNFDMASGKYSCVVSIAPSHASKRQEAVEAMMQLVGKNPQLFAIIGDLVVDNMDWPGAQAIVKRLKKALPANLQDDDTGKDPVPPQFMAKFQALSQQHDQLVHALGEANETIRSKKLELSSKEYIVGLQEQTKLVLADIKLNSEEAREILKSEISRIQQKIDLMHDAMMADNGGGSPNPPAPVPAASAA